MTSDQLEPVINAFAPAQLLPTFSLFAPYILSVVAIVLAVSLIQWGIKTVRHKLSFDDSSSLTVLYDNNGDEYYMQNGKKVMTGRDLTNYKKDNYNMLDSEDRWP